MNFAWKASQPLLLASLLGIAGCEGQVDEAPDTSDVTDAREQEGAPTLRFAKIISSELDEDYGGIYVTQVTDEGRFVEFGENPYEEYGSEGRVFLYSSESDSYLIEQSGYADWVQSPDGAYLLNTERSALDGGASNAFAPEGVNLPVPGEDLLGMSRDGDIAVFFGAASEDGLEREIISYQFSTGETRSMALTGFTAPDSNGLSRDYVFGSNFVLSGDGRFVFSHGGGGLTGGSVGDPGYAEAVIVRIDLQTQEVSRLPMLQDGEPAPYFHGSLFSSHDGGFVSFYSETPLLEADTNAKTDVYRLNTETGELDLVSVTPENVAGNGRSYGGSLSADARYVAFSSTSGTLVAGDTLGVSDVFLRDMQEGTTFRLSESPHGEGDGSSYDPIISPDASYIAFSSGATNLTEEPPEGWGSRILLLELF